MQKKRKTSVQKHIRNWLIVFGCLGFGFWATQSANLAAIPMARHYLTKIELPEWFGSSQYSPMAALGIGVSKFVSGFFKSAESKASLLYKEKPNADYDHLRRQDAARAFEQVQTTQSHHELTKSAKPSEPGPQEAQIKQMFENSKVELYKPSWFKKTWTPAKNNEKIDRDLLSLLDTLDLDPDVLVQLTEYTQAFKARFHSNTKKTRLPDLILAVDHTFKPNDVTKILIAIAQELSLDSTSYSLEPFAQVEDSIGLKAIQKLTASLKKDPKSPKQLVCLYHLGDLLEDKESKIGKHLQTFLSVHSQKVGIILVQESTTQISKSILEDFTSKKANFVITIKHKASL